MKISILRNAKLAYFKNRLHKILGPAGIISPKLKWMNRLSAWISRHQDLPLNDFPSGWNYEKRYLFYQRILEGKKLLNTPINYLEFGVASGASFKWFLSQNTHPESRFYGFDTFTGLPEDFGSYKKGTFNTNNQVPEINDPRGSFYQGLFQQTLPGFLPKLRKNTRNLVMIDADLYSATLYVLQTLAPHLSGGDIIFFDEFAVPMHEFRAYYEVAQAGVLKLEPIGAANNFYFVGFEVR